MPLESPCVDSIRRSPVSQSRDQSLGVCPVGDGSGATRAEGSSSFVREAGLLVFCQPLSALNAGSEIGHKSQMVERLQLII